ncbi:MAG: class I SAM-dependent methyltransferase [Nitrospiraceae bacterium]|nr:class I SAM-dependent methyltransferase [Nitrospiraceae bacterium]
MTEFDKTNWAKPDFGKRFIGEANISVVERRRMLEILKSFFRHHRKDTGDNAVLDLGCGDGILTHELLTVDPDLSATLVDGSAAMLERAQGRLEGFTVINCVQASFQDMLRDDILNQKFDFIVSSLAIHHLSSGEKKELFGLVYLLLSDGGHFLNIDVVLAPTPALDGFYMNLWQEWIEQMKASHGITGKGSATSSRNTSRGLKTSPTSLITSSRH